MNTADAEHRINYPVSESKTHSVRIYIFDYLFERTL